MAIDSSTIQTTMGYPVGYPPTLVALPASFNPNPPFSLDTKQPPMGQHHHSTGSSIPLKETVEPSVSYTALTTQLKQNPIHAARSFYAQDVLTPTGKKYLRAPVNEPRTGVEEVDALVKQGNTVLDFTSKTVTDFPKALFKGATSGAAAGILAGITSLGVVHSKKVAGMPASAWIALLGFIGMAGGGIYATVRESLHKIQQLRQTLLT